MVAYDEAFNLSLQSGAHNDAATCAINLGQAYKDVPALRDFSRAEHWYERSLDLAPDRHRLLRGRCKTALGTLALQRLWESVGEAPESTSLHHLETAERFYREALGEFPPDAIAELAAVHNQLGRLYGPGDSHRGLAHYREAIRYNERARDVYSAASNRLNIANTLYIAGRLADTREYATAALRGFESFGDNANEAVEMARELITRIDGGAPMQRG